MHVEMKNNKGERLYSRKYTIAMHRSSTVEIRISINVQLMTRAGNFHVESPFALRSRKALGECKINVRYKVTRGIRHNLRFMRFTWLACQV